MKRWPRFTIGTLFIMVAVVAGFLAGNHSGYLAGHDSGHQQWKTRTQQWQTLPTINAHYRVADEIISYKTTLAGQSNPELILESLVQTIKSEVWPEYWDSDENATIVAGPHQDVRVKANKLVHTEVRAFLLNSVHDARVAQAMPVAGKRMPPSNAR